MTGAERAVCFFLTERNASDKMTGAERAVCFCSETEPPAIIAGGSLYKINLAVIGKVYFSIKGVSLYQFWCLGAESNHRHRDFQSLALPTELPRLGKIIF